MSTWRPNDWSDWRLPSLRSCCGGSRFSCLGGRRCRRRCMRLGSRPLSGLCRSSLLLPGLRLQGSPLGSRRNELHQAVLLQVLRKPARQFHSHSHTLPLSNTYKRAGATHDTSTVHQHILRGRINVEHSFWGFRRARHGHPPCHVLVELLQRLAQGPLVDGSHPIRLLQAVRVAHEFVPEAM